MKRLSSLAILVSIGTTTAAHAGTTYLDNPQQYDMRRYLEGAQYRPRQPLAARCLEEEQASRLTTTCERYKRELNRLLREQER